MGSEMCIRDRGLVAGGRLWAAVLTVPATAMLTFSGLIWLVYTVLGGGLTPLYFILVGLGGASVVSSVIAVGLSARVHRARQALLSD